MWWYGCSNVPSTFFGLIMMLVFMSACMVMFFMMRRHWQPGGHGSMSFDARLGPWWNIGLQDTSYERPSTAFEEYREQTLRGLEEEQVAFKGFLDQLRLARDRAEFDQFMAQRKSGRK